MKITSYIYINVLFIIVVILMASWRLSIDLGLFGHTDKVEQNTEDLYSADIIFKDGTLGNKDRPLNAKVCYIIDAESVICTNCKNVRIIFDSLPTRLEYDYRDGFDSVGGAWTEIKYVIQ